MRLWPAAITAFGGLAGAAGVALSAYATHSGGSPNLTIAAQFLLFHAGPLLLLGVFVVPRKSMLVSASTLALGVALFSGDLTMRATLGQALFTMAAPSGGLLMIGGWLALAVVGATMRVRKTD